MQGEKIYFSRGIEAQTVVSKMKLLTFSSTILRVCHLNSAEVHHHSDPERDDERVVPAFDGEPRLQRVVLSVHRRQLQQRGSKVTKSILISFDKTK